jgi:3-hydroxy-9,10-secoandrosta-1,3,5(10)-triene-9,17-dione monooxygenase
VGDDSGQAVVSAVSELLPLLRERAQEAEDARSIPAESIKALAETGIFRMLQPARFGGLEADPAAFLTAARMTASACGSTGWVASVVGVHPWQLSLFPAQAQRDVWGADPDALLSSSYAPTGRARAVPGGHRLSGRWSFCSGCAHAGWVLLGQTVTGAGGRPADFRTFLVPRADYVIDDVWDTVGLRGIGSNDIVVADAFVPEHRSLSSTDISRCACPGQRANPAPLYRIPFGSIFSYAITAPIIGMAMGAHDARAAQLRERARRGHPGQRAAPDPFVRARVAEACAALERNMAELMEHARAGRPIPMLLRLRVRRDQVRAADNAIGAVDRLFENCGGRALQAGTPVQRFWRDAHAGRVHAMNDIERALSMFGGSDFGHPVLADALL